MGGSSSSRHISVESEDAEGVVFVKGIRLTDRVIDRMREPPPVQSPQSKSSTCPPVGQPLTPQSETLASTELLAPVLPHPPSYASALVPPPLQEPISPLVPLVSVGQETPAPPTSTPTVEAVPSVTHTAPESVPAPVPSVQEHIVISTPTDSAPPAPPAEPLPITTSPLTFTEPVVMPLPAEPVPVVLSPSAEVVDISPPPITDTVTSPPPSELIAIPAEAPTMPLTDDVLTAPPAEAIPLPTTVDIPVESSVPSTPTLTLDTTIPVEQVELPTTATSEPVAETEMPLSPDTTLPSPIESVEISTDMPPAPVEPSNLEELLPPLPACALAVPCEVPSVGHIGCPPSEDPPAPTPVVQPAVASVLPPLTETVGPLTSPQAVVNEEDLRKQIREELQKLLQEEMKMAELKIQRQLEEEKAKAEAEAQAKAQQQIQAEVQKVLEKEQLALQQTLKDVIMQERKNIEDEQLASQYYWMERKIQKLEEKERDLAKQDSMYKEQIAKLEGKTAQFTRVTAESFKKGLEETHKRFKRHQIKPVCSELQSEILKCYLQNTGQTLTCSSIASEYVKCVNNAKQNKKVSTGG
ncbi:coiled-coil-helix-coiled-coil-helix domain containing 3b isoform X1 [Pangasianodon hypophthalmus]|uniref:coiled-coil-helix-coiled-coil-helix domain containing 3b isoform X1 n=1 Tax=Pangasianodon hypophthalmus TaxID=310915 RepID=UPI000EFF8778|nr:coiled-coil-helix-coiled-coil-helix domain containing 3b isoform X1 [Pangasianodon hypophthalmus]